MKKMNAIGKANANQPVKTWQPRRALTDDGRRYFDEILSNRASFDWSNADVIIVTRLADWLATADALNERLQTEGVVIENSKGTPVMNPVCTAIDTMERRIMAGFTRLGIFRVSLATATLEHVAQRGKNAKAISAAAGDDDDGLLK